MSIEIPTDNVLRSMYKGQKTPLRITMKRNLKKQQPNNRLKTDYSQKKKQVD